MSKLATDPPAVVETRLVHNAHRRATSLLAEAAARPSVPSAALAELRVFVVAMLHHHHEAEDRDLWPLITTIAPELSDPLAGFSGEHQRLDAALEVLDATTTRDGADRAALHDASVEVRDVLHQHLDREERLLLPALRTVVSEEAWASFSQQVIATAPTDGTHLLIALFDEVGTPDEVELMLGSLPVSARELVPALREQARATLDALRATST